MHNVSCLLPNCLNNLWVAVPSGGDTNAYSTGAQKQLCGGDASTHTAHDCQAYQLMLSVYAALKHLSQQVAFPASKCLPV